MVFQLLIKCGSKEFYANIDSSPNEQFNEANSSNYNKPLKTVQELRQFIAEQLLCDPNSMKIIYKGNLA